LPGSRCSRTGRWRSNARDLGPQLVKINCGVRGLQVPIWRVRTCPNGSSMLLPRALRPTEYIGRSLPLSDETVHHLDLGRGSHRTWSWTLDLQTVVEAWYLRGTIPSDDPRSSIARAATPVNDNTARRSRDSPRARDVHAEGDAGAMGISGSAGIHAGMGARLRYIRCGTLRGPVEMSEYLFRV
jgi:hypothetical protein